MARTLGALNKRTRAALHAVKEGQLDGNGLSAPVRYLLGIVANHHKPEALRIEAAKAVAPYLQPKLSSVEMTQNTEPMQTEEALLARVDALLRAHPELARRMLKYASAAQSAYDNPESQGFQPPPH